MKTFLRRLGAWFLSLLGRMGHIFLFLINALYYIFIPPFKFDLLLRQMRFLGSKSMAVILLTGSFTGMVLALQLFHTLRKFGSEALF